MDSMVDDTQAGKRPGGPGTPARPGQSGEGSRSIMEHLIQQQRKRDAQLPREHGDTGQPPDAAP